MSSDAGFIPLHGSVFISASFAKTRDSFIRHTREFISRNVSRGNNLRVPYPLSPTPALFTSIGLMLSTLHSCQYNLPDGTLALILVHGLVFMKPNGHLLRNVSLQPYEIVANREYHRLIVAAFVHMDLPHMLFNVNALIESGLVLEERMGSVPFVVEVLLLTLLTHELYIVVAWIESFQFNRPKQYFFTSGIGLSCVTFALNFFTRMVNAADPTVESYLPFVPVSYHVWVQLAITQFIFPHSSLFGHLIGIAAGMIRVFCPSPFLWIRRKVTSLVQFMTQRPLRNRRDDEYHLTGSRQNWTIFPQLGFLGIAYGYYLFQTRKSK